MIALRVCLAAFALAAGLLGSGLALEAFDRLPHGADLPLWQVPTWVVVGVATLWAVPGCAVLGAFAAIAVWGRR